MKAIEFFQILQQKLSLPFEISEVKNVESNCDSVYVDLNDGSTYFISVERCEKED